MHSILLHPTDVLFFRDGRPMSGASSGKGAAWPLPSVINHAFHAALHRAGDVLAGVHPHRQKGSGSANKVGDRKFGSLVTAGPFPVCVDNGAFTWFFPRPADADDRGEAFLRPANSQHPSSLPRPVCYPVVSSNQPSKESRASWWNRTAWEHYLTTPNAPSRPNSEFRIVSDSDFSDTEHSYGIEISTESGTVIEGNFYSAHYLRLREGWRMGVLAKAEDKDFQHKVHESDLIRTLLSGDGSVIIAGGQQRVCTAQIQTAGTEHLPLPMGVQIKGKFVKWILLSPAVWPEIPEGASKRGTLCSYHPGGWLPNWICPESGDVLLEFVTPEERRRRRRLTYRQQGYESNPSRAARLVAAVVPKAIPVTGYATVSPHWDQTNQGGAKSTHLAVPAGAVYYFEARSEDAARQLAAALNWHGSDTHPTTIRNRRSTLMGEKGFGLGVCGMWDFHSEARS